MQPEVLNRIKEIEEILRPVSLWIRQKTYVLTPRWDTFDLAGKNEAEVEDDLRGWREASEKAEEIGQRIANEPEMLAQLLPAVMQGQDIGRRDLLGVGLATAAPNLEDMWQTLKAAFSSAPEQDRNGFVLEGFLIGTSRRSGNLWQYFWIQPSLTQP